MFLMATYTDVDNFLAKWNGRSIDRDGVYGAQLVYNVVMKTLVIPSKKHGKVAVKLDRLDYDGIKQLGGKWTPTIKRNRLYLQKRIGGKIIELQRYIMKPQKGEYVDHINHDTLDNRRSNLRICTNAANIRNGKIRNNNSSGYTGVFQKRDKWGARIRVNYKNITIGGFGTFEEALGARITMEHEYGHI